MLSFTQIALLLTVASAIAHQKVVEPSRGHLLREEPTERILLTSRGGAVIERHSAKNNPDGGDADQAGGDQGDVSKPTYSEGYAQDVTGSTPTGYIKMGTPEKLLKVIFDTGSDVLIAKTWLTVKAEMSKVDQGVEGSYMPTEFIYDSKASSTYEEHMHKNSEGKWIQLQEEINYGSGPAQLLNGFDTVRVGHFEMKNFSISEIMDDRLPMLHKDDNISGVLGLQHMKNRTSGTSLFTLMREQDQLAAFGYCRGTGDTGTFIWGDHSTEGEEVEVVGQIHWALKLGKMTVKMDASATTNSAHDHSLKKHHRHHDVIKVFQRDAKTNEGFDIQEPDDTEEKSGDDEASDLAKDICKDSSCIAIMDTGSNILAGPHDVMAKLSKELNVDPDCKNFDSLPDITFKLGESQEVTVTPQGYVMKVPYEEDGGFGEEAAASLRQGAKMGWKEMFQNLHKTRGIDLSPAYGHLDLDTPPDDTSSGEAQAKTPAFKCMPALVTMDKKTKLGPLYIVGTPMMQTNYVRWSWAKNDDSPKMFIKPLKDSATCGNAKTTSASLMRSDPLENTLGFDSLGQSSGPFIRRIQDIRYPHWATLLEDGADI